MFNTSTILLNKGPPINNPNYPLMKHFDKDEYIKLHLVGYTPVIKTVFDISREISHLKLKRHRLNEKLLMNEYLEEEKELMEMTIDYLTFKIADTKVQKLNLIKNLGLDELYETKRFNIYCANCKLLSHEFSFNKELAIRKHETIHNHSIIL